MSTLNDLFNSINIHEESIKLIEKMFKTLSQEEKKMIWRWLDGNMLAIDDMIRVLVDMIKLEK